MKLGKTLKRISAVVMVFAMIFGVLGMTGSTLTAKASSNPVKMYCYDNYINWRGYLESNVYIQVDANSAANKAVYVHYNDGTDEWADEAATYVTKIDNNTEIWKAHISGLGISSEYAIKYVGDGQVYWDNNNGNNYNDSNVLGQANVLADRLSFQSPSSYMIRAIVKNLAYSKTVTVRYTQDNWATYQDVPLSYSSSIIGTDLEQWSVTLNLNEESMDSFQYCIRYDVNGQTYWDNNFGANYDRSFYSPL